MLFNVPIFCKLLISYKLTSLFQMQLACYLLIICVIGSIECGLRYKRDDEPEVKEETVEVEKENENTPETSKGGTEGKFPFIPENVQSWFDKFPGGGPNQWFVVGGNKWVEDAGSFFSKTPWFNKEK